jgi:hypothetical protein
MNRLIASGLVLLTLCLLPALNFAEKPPPPKPLAERVNLSTRVFVGRAKRVQACEVIAGKIQEITPEPSHTSPGIALEIDATVEETLYPLDGQEPQTVTIIYAPGIIPISEVRRALLAEDFVYLTRRQLFGADAFLVPSYPWHLVEKLSAKAEIVASLKKRTRR